MDPTSLFYLLYKPAVPGNIGACARALKTMGFENLRLIDPADHLSKEAFMLAHGSREILERARVFPDLESAVQDLDFLVATTAKKKRAKVDYIPANDLPAFLAEKGPAIGKVGILFGTEESGLPAKALVQSNVGVTIPMAVDYPSLNLAQSVMLIAYELGRPGLTKKKDEPVKQKKSEWKELQERTIQILLQLDVQPGNPLFHRILERLSFLKASDANLVHSITSRMLDLLNPEKE